jgi:hypothetical protein
MNSNELLIKATYTSDKAVIYLAYTPSNRSAVIQAYINGNLTYEIVRKETN